MKILIIKHGSLGDLVLSFGAIKSIRDHHPKSKIYLLTQSGYKKIFRNLPYVNSIFVDDRMRNHKSIIKYLGIIKKKKIDLIIDLQNSSRTQIYHFFTRIFCKTKILSAKKFSTVKYLQKPQGLQHVTKNHQDQLKLLKIYNFSKPDLSWMTKSKSFKNRKYVIFIPSASKSGDYKKWPIKKYAAVANYLINKEYEVYLTGSMKDIDDINAIIELCPKAQNKIAESKIEFFYELCMKSSLIISNDTGPAHIAGLTNKNLIWLANDNTISKSCYPLGKNIHKIVSKDVKNIDTKAVIKKIDQII
tara:strand:+ start:1453 stop:2361 length:909 start_codon:yes stop_codon:yes gene_type:complete